MPSWQLDEPQDGGVWRLRSPCQPTTLLLPIVWPLSLPASCTFEHEACIPISFKGRFRYWAPVGLVGAGRVQIHPNHLFNSVIFIPVTILDRGKLRLDIGNTRSDEKWCQLREWLYYLMKFNHWCPHQLCCAPIWNAFLPIDIPHVYLHCRRPCNNPKVSTRAAYSFLPNNISIQHTGRQRLLPVFIHWREVDRVDSSLLPCATDRHKPYSLRWMPGNGLSNLLL